jgi:cell division protein FtsL
MGRAAAATALRPRRSHVAPGSSRPTTARRRSGAAQAAGARAPGARAGEGRAVPTPLPVRLWQAPFARTARARTSRVLDALLSGRGWIALVFLLLAGIVFFNVDLLQLNRDIAANSDRIAQLKRENARLLLDQSRLAASERIQEEAAKLGLVLPAPGEVRYLKARPTEDARRAAKRITAPNDVAPEPAPDSAASGATGTTTTGTTGATGTSGLDPATGLPVDPATGAPVYDPVTGAPLDPITRQPLDLSTLGAGTAGAPAGTTTADPAGAQPTG